MQDYTGQFIDRYRIIKQQGMGGMAMVLHGFDTRLQRDVAIKLIRSDNIPQSQQNQLSQRFEREARMQARLQHPHIVPVYDYGEFEGAPYLVMAYVSGPTLKDLLKNRIPYHQAARLLLPIVDALCYAHERKLIHRDIKPSNILFGENNQPILTDFGIAKVLETDELTLTGTGVGIGTPEYMAPEQWHGQVVPQTDIYALGVVLYEMITATKPYIADTPTGVAILQATQAIKNPSQFVSGLPASVDALLIKALSRNPQDRHTDMSDFGNALQELLVGIEDEQSNLALFGDSQDTREESDLLLRETMLDSQHVKRETSSVETGKRRDSQILDDEDFLETITMVPDQAEFITKKKRFPAWLLWLLGGLILFGSTLGVKLASRTDASQNQPAAIALTTAPQGLATASAIVTPSQTSTMTITPTHTQTPTITTTATPTLGIGSTLLREKDGMQMVFVPAGPFMMGSDEDTAYERPVHEVYLDAYWIDKFEVSNEQYAKFAEETGYVTQMEPGRGVKRPNNQDTREYSGVDWRHPLGTGSSLAGRENHPVYLLLWQDAEVYCRWVGGRLPTEAEWEKAARGTDQRRYPWGDEDPTCSLANYAGCVGGTRPVGSYPAGASPFGVMDMAGNVMEFVYDWFATTYYEQSPRENPSGTLGYQVSKVIRGGGFIDPARDLRTTYRGLWPFRYVYNTYQISQWRTGFRCVIPTVYQITAIISAEEGAGIIVRDAPALAGNPLEEPYTTLLNNTQVLILDNLTNEDGAWSHIQLISDESVRGWVLSSMLEIE